MNYTLWVEGYVDNGGHGTARYLGSVSADSFVEAVQKWHDENNGYQTWGRLDVKDGRCYLWGCEVYDSERKARASFG